MRPLNQFFKMAVMSGVKSAAQLHIDRGDDINARDSNGLTLLMLLAAKNKTAMCRFLLEAGADSSLLDPSGRTAYAIAISAGAQQVADVLKPIASAAVTSEMFVSEQTSATNIVTALSQVEGNNTELPVETSSMHETINTQALLSVAPVTIDCDDYGFQLSDWTAEEELQPPEPDFSIVADAGAIQIAISAYKPIDSSTDWDDVEAFLPDQSVPFSRKENLEAREHLRLTLIRAIREGSVPEMEVDSLSVDEDGNYSQEFKELLTLVINDLGAEVDERIEYVTYDENFSAYFSKEEAADEEEVIDNAIDEATDSVLELLEDPQRADQWDRRGLVVGHVQSGKTSNYSGLICKAADAGYKIIIVLAGLHNNLRSQTQMRLEESFLGYETTSDRDPGLPIGVAEFGDDLKTNSATTRAENGDFSKLPEGQGFAVERVDPQGDDKLWLALTRKAAGIEDLFASMASDVVGALDDAAIAGSDEQKLLRVFISRVGAWQEFMRKGLQALSPEAEIGLLGELAVLRSIIDAGVPASFAVESWLGPLDALQDFELGSGALEIKSTLSTVGFPAKIGSLEQLEDSVRQPLFVVCVRLKQATAGNTLSEIVDEMRCIVKGEPEAERLLEERLLAAGFIDKHGDRYSRRFVLASMRILEVDKDFPRLTLGNVPTGIMKASYEIDLDKPIGTVLEIDEALKKLGAMKL